MDLNWKELFLGNLIIAGLVKDFQVSNKNYEASLIFNNYIQIIETKYYGYLDNQKNIGKYSSYFILHFTNHSNEKLFDLLYVFHRDGDLPAIDNPTGNKSYYKNGKRHREGDLPAIEYKNGSKFYYKNGELHRDGNLPACRNSDGHEEYYRHGILYR